MKTVMRAILFLCFMLVPAFVFAGPADTASAKSISEKKAIRIAKRHGAYPSRINFQYEPIVRFDTSSGAWMIGKTRVKHKSRGQCQLEKNKIKENGKTERTSSGRKKKCNCRHTNGCTFIKSKYIRIDARTGKVLKIEKEKDVFPNYE